MIHSEKTHPVGDILEGFSLEVSAKDVSALAAVASCIAPGTMVAIPYLASEDDRARLAATRAVRHLGFEPLLHISARRVESLAALEAFVERAVAEAEVEHCLVIAGDRSTPVGPFVDSAMLIESGVLERAGIRAVSVGGHPESHPFMSAVERWDVLERKCAELERRGLAPSVITQFLFDADTVLAWLKALRARGIGHPVRIGVPGPAGMATLARYAALCGVGASASMLSRYGISIGRLFGTAGPDIFVDRLSAGLTHDHGKVNLHFFPFGGLEQSMRWIERHRTRPG